MENRIYGIVVLFFCSIAYLYAFKQFRQANYSASVAFITLCGISIYIYTSADFFLHVWDERYHALVAKNMMKNPFMPTLYDNPVLPYDYKIWVGNHIWLHKQPLPLWLMAGSMKVFGVNEIALRLPSIVMSSLGIVLTFKVGTYFFNKKIGVLAAFLFSINGLIIELTAGRVATDHVDIAFMFFILLAIYLITVYIGRKNVLFTFGIGASIGAAILTKWLAGLIVLPIWLGLVIHSNKFKTKTILTQFALLILTISVIAIPWQIYIFSNFPLEAAYEASFNLKHLTEEIEGRSGSIFYFINQIRINYGELIYLPLIWFLWKLFKKPINLKTLSLLIWFIVPMLIFSIAKTKMQGYLLFTAPALFIITSAFIFELKDFNLTQKKTPRFFIKVLLAVFILIPFRYGIERMKPFAIRERQPEWVLELKNLNERNIENGILFNYSNPIEAMFYTNLIVYSTVPSAEMINQLKREGYRVMVNENRDFTQLENLEGVERIKLKEPDNL